MGRRLRTKRYRLLVGGFVFFLVVLVLGVVGSGDESDVTSSSLREDFSMPSQTWDPLSDSSVDARFEDGEYVIGVKAPDYTFVDEAVWSGAQEFGTIQAQARVEMTQEGSGRFGVLCYSNPGTAEAPGGVFARYELFLTSSGGYGVAKWLNGSSEILELKEKGSIGSSDPMDLLVRCEGGPSARLRMVLDGETLVELEDPSGLASFEGSGVVVGSEKQPGLEVAFDDLIAGPSD
jgi:hypothetical protein